MKKQIKSSQISQNALLNLPLKEKIFWLNWINESIRRRESKEKKAIKHINWLRRLEEKLKINIKSITK